MKAKEVIEKYNITRRTLHNWVKTGVIKVEKTPSGRYIYLEKTTLSNTEIYKESKLWQDKDHITP